MRITRQRLGVVAVMSVCLLVASCASVISEPSKVPLATSFPVSSTPPSVTHLPPPVSGPSPGGSTQPTIECAEFLSSTPCGTYSSVRGESGGQDVAWIGTGAVTARLTAVSGSLYLTVTTPCSPLSGPASVAGGIMQLGSIAVGAMGCAGDAASQQAWVLEFLKRPIKMAYINGTLTWLSGADTLDFKSP